MKKDERIEKKKLSKFYKYNKRIFILNFKTIIKLLWEQMFQYYSFTVFFTTRSYLISSKVYDLKTWK